MDSSGDDCLADVALAGLDQIQTLGDLTFSLDVVPKLEVHLLHVHSYWHQGLVVDSLNTNSKLKVDKRCLTLKKPNEDLRKSIFLPISLSNFGVRSLLSLVLTLELA